MRLYINVFFYLSVSIKMKFMVKLYAVIVGATIGRPQDRNISFDIYKRFVC